MTVMIECDRAMIKHLFRLWYPSRLLPNGRKLSRDRPRFLKRQNYVCEACGELLTDDHMTHLDHKVPVKEFAEKVLNGELTFDEAYLASCHDDNIRAVHRRCNYRRNRKVK